MRTPARLRAITTLLVSLALGACASGEIRPVPSGPGANGPAAGALDVVGTLAPGASVGLPPGNPLGARVVHLVDEYPAASGRRCRRVALEAPGGPVRVVCRRADGHWSATRSLTRGERVGAAGAADVVAGVRANEDGVDTLADGETLWAFAERTTGQGDNWSAIARVNGIDDPDRVGAGRALALPDGLESGR